MTSISDMVGMYGITGVDFPPAPLPTGPHEPAWDIARLFPAQGRWTEEQYLQLTEVVNWPIEFEKGMLEFLPMPTIEHQLILRLLFDSLREYVDVRKLGQVLFGPLPTWLDDERYREPDLLFVTNERHSRSAKYYRGADMAVEIVSPDERSRTRDIVEKRQLYAAASITEYWIVDPQEETITVLALEGQAYVEHCIARAGEVAKSKLLDGFEVDVTAVFAAGKQR